MAQNRIQESLEQFTKRNLRTYVMMNTFYYTIRDTTINKLFAKYIFNTFCYNEELEQLKRLNLCEKILNNPRLIFAEDTVKQLISLCSTDDWKQRIKSEFENYKIHAPMELKQLFRLKLASFTQLKRSNIYNMFHTEMIHQTKHIKNLLTEIYVENHSNV